MTQPQTLKRFDNNKFTIWLGRMVYKMIGWQVEGSVPESVPKSVMIVAHHTSNWDFPLGLFASFLLRIKPFWIGKHTLFHWPLGRLMRWLGGIPIDRRASKDFVNHTIQLFNEHEKLMIVITPEGTRKRRDQWKSGFYHIANGASVPIICAFIDYKRKVTGIGPMIMPSGDIQADMKKIRAFYQTITAKKPENVGEMVFRSKNQ